MRDLFDQCKNNFSGNPADYIPELAKGPRGNVLDRNYMDSLRRMFDTHGGHLYKRGAYYR